MFVPNTDPIRPNIIAMLIAIPLKLSCMLIVNWMYDVIMTATYRKLVGNKSMIAALTMLTAKKVSMKVT